MLSEERRAAIVRLLGVVTEGLERSVEPMSRLGFVHRATVDETCEDCLANGFVSRDCETCGGRGVVERRRGRDPYDTGLASGWFGSSSEVHERRRERDAEIARLEAQTSDPRPEAELVADAQPEGWEVARRRLRGRFSVAEADLALAALAVVDVDACRAVYAVHVYGWLPAEGLAGRLAERGLEFLDVRLPTELLVPAAEEAVEVRRPRTLAERNREVRRLSREGAATQWIAAQFGVSVATVNRVLAGDEAAA